MPKVKDKTRTETKRVRFSVRLPNADEVVITGDFTGWDPEGIPLHHDGHDEWYGYLELRPGDYQYRLRVDGEWRDDPMAGARVPNPFGTQNCVLTVG